MARNGIIEQMRDETCTVVENVRLSKNYFLSQLKTETIAKLVDPPLFPLLRRPFAIMKVDAPHLWLYYEVVGRGTQLLSGHKQGDEVVVLGPLGNSFPTSKNKSLLMVAGGRGIAPLFFAASEFSKNNRVGLIYGAKTKDDLNLVEQLKSLPLQQLVLYTEDGSAGQKGLVTQGLGQFLQEHAVEVTFSCGPERMLAAVNHELQEANIENFVSLEAVMGCGFGVCHSCVVPVKTGGYGKVCTDGTVFPLEAIDWQTYL